MSGRTLRSILPLLVIGLLPAAEVGSDGRLQGLRFEGNERIPTPALIHALAVDVEVAAARHPRADRASYAGVLEGRLLRAYRASGFADAAVLVLPAEGGWSVEIREGERRRCGPVVFEGELGELALADLRTALKEGGEEHAAQWAPAGYAPAHRGWEAPLQVAIGAWLIGRGLHGGAFSLAQRPGVGESELVVTFARAPQAADVAAVAVEGLADDQAAVVAAELAPLVGEPADGSALERGRAIALASGRVLACGGGFTPGGAGPTLVLSATPLPGAPAADEALGELEREVIAATEHLIAALADGTRSAALVMRAPELELVLQADVVGGSLVLASGEQRSAFGIDGSGVRLRRHDGSSLAVPLTGEGGMTVSLRIHPDGDDGKMSFSTNAGIRSSGPRWEATFDLHPAALVGKVRRRTGIEEVAEDRVRISVPSSEDPAVIGWIELDRAAGVVTAIETGSTGPGTGMRLRFEPVAAPAEGAAADAVADWPALGAALGAELPVWREWLLATGEIDAAILAQVERGGSLLLRVLPAIASVADGVMADWDAAQAVAFAGPEPEPGGHPMLRVLRPAACGLQAALEASLPVESWPITILREAVMITGGQGQYTGRELDRLYRDPRTGPVGSLAVAGALLLIGQGEPAEAFLRRGAELCDWPQARVDAQLLMPLLAPVVAQLDADDRAAILALLPAALRPQVERALAGDAAPVEQALQLVWDAQLGDQLRGLLLGMLDQPEEEAGDAR